MKNTHNKKHLSFHSHSLPFNPFHSLFLAAALLLVSCEKENTSDPSGETDVTTGATRVLILNEGSWGFNNSTISELDPAHREITVDWFSSVNGRGLGDVAQDMIAYGSKIYATVTFSNSLEVIDAHSGNATRVDMGNRKPRYIAADGGKLYITCYNPCSVVRVDTATLAIEATCTLGNFQPEGIAVAKGKAFVASSNISDAAGNYTYDDKLYVVDLATFADPVTLTVGCNPQEVMEITDGKLIVNYWGDYYGQPAGSALVDAATLAVTPTGQALTKFTVYNGKAYGYATTYDESWNQTISYLAINADGSVAAFPFSPSLDENPYGLGIDPKNGYFYLFTDGNYSTNGSVYCFSPSGQKCFVREAAILPKKALFLN